MMGRRLTHGVPLRLALLAGFGLTAGLWALVGYLTWQSTAEANRTEAELNARYLRAQDLLTSIREEVLAASGAVRDALLDPAITDLSHHRQQVTGAFQTIDARLQGYVHVLGNVDKGQRLERLREEIDRFRLASLETLETGGAGRPAGSARLRRLLAQRRPIMDVTDELQSINREAYVQHQGEAQLVRTRLQRNILTVWGVAFAASLLIAAWVFKHSATLERVLAEQRQREQGIIEDLQRLAVHVVEVQDAERRRIACELHDEVGQSLSAVNLELATAQRRLQRAGFDEGMLEDARALTDAALRDVRNLSQLLHPSVLDDLGLGAALRSLTTGMARRAGVRIDLVDETCGERLPVNIERTVYRIVQEGTSNALRHGRAAGIAIRLAREGGELVLDIADDGVGFDTTRARSHDEDRGLGVLGMRERINQLGGSFAIDSAPGRGTRLSARVPLPQAVAVAPAVPATPGAPATKADRHVRMLREVTHG